MVRMCTNTACDKAILVDTCQSDDLKTGQLLLEKWRFTSYGDLKGIFTAYFTSIHTICC